MPLKLYYKTVLGCLVPYAGLVTEQPLSMVRMDQGAGKESRWKGWRALLQCGEHFLHKHENLSLDPTTHTKLNMVAYV